MPARPILQLGHPLLRRVSAAAADPAATRLVFRDLAATLHAFQLGHGFGRGISAVQIGELVRCIYLEFEGASYELVNPVYGWLSEEKFELWDDCFSFPHLMVRVERHQSLGLEYQTPDGARRRLEASGALSELVQHEMDHLDGILAVDRAIDRDSLATREEYLRRHFRP
jgi:peptide deformylase